MRGSLFGQVAGMAILPSTLLGILPVGCLLSMRGTLSAETFLSVIVLSFGVMQPLITAFSHTDDIAQVRTIVGEVADVLSGEDMQRPEKAEKLPADNSIELKNVRFAYHDKEVLHGVSLRIEPGTVNALVGPSGSGKTTLCNLMARFWDVQAGSVTLGGRDVREYSYDSLIRNFSFVFQRTYLFSGVSENSQCDRQREIFALSKTFFRRNTDVFQGKMVQRSVKRSAVRVRWEFSDTPSDTIANNIRFGRPDATLDEVKAAAKKARCYDFITALPDGFDTVIGEGGATLSGGERQRISIARAMMKDAPIIILDEATANIDAENEKELMEAVAALTRSKTVIMIAHRLKTVRNADQIFVVDRGEIVQQGTHDELVAVDGLYRRFVVERRQAAGWKV